VRISAALLVTLSEVSRGSPQYLLTNSAAVLSSRLVTNLYNYLQLHTLLYDHCSRSVVIKTKN